MASLATGLSPSKTVFVQASRQDTVALSVLLTMTAFEAKFFGYPTRKVQEAWELRQASYLLVLLLCPIEEA